MQKENKLGICGLACFKCLKYTSKKCSGCEPNEFCLLPECAKKRGVNLCFECKEFPCDLNYKEGPIVKKILDFHKENSF